MFNLFVYEMSSQERHRDLEPLTCQENEIYSAIVIMVYVTLFYNI